MFFLLILIFSSSLPKTLPIQNYGQHNQGYGGMSRLLKFDQQPEQVQQVQQMQTLTPAGKILYLFYLVKYYFLGLSRSSLSRSTTRNCYSIRKWSYICCLSC